MIFTLHGLGATTAGGSQIPDRYLIPATKEQIDRFINREKYGDTNKEQLMASVLWHPDCNSDWSGEYLPCHRIMTEIERGNLYFVNGIIDYDRLQAIYSQAEAELADIPRLQSFKEQLKNSGQFIMGAVAGFIAGGPIGLFVGAAGAVKKIIADEKALRANRAGGLVNQQQQNDLVNSTEQERFKDSILSIFKNPAVQFTGLALALGASAYLILKSDK